MGCRQVRSKAYGFDPYISGVRIPPPQPTIIMRITYSKEKKKKKRHSKPLPRQVHIDGKEWRWEYVGSTVKILSPEEKYWCIKITDFTGMDYDTIERGEYKKWFHMTPSFVKEYIEKNLAH